MKYRNAAEILPEKLLEELQRYAEGELLYIPRAVPQRRWGEENGSRAYYSARNEEIRAEYRSGISMEMLSEKYGLARSTIRRIIYE